MGKGNEGRGVIMGVLDKVPFLAGYNEQDQINRAQENQGLMKLSQLMQMQKGGLEVSALQEKMAQDKQQREMINAFASRLPTDQQAEFRVDPKGFMEARRSENEIKSYLQGQQPQQKQNLSGFEPIPATQPNAPFAGMQGIAGNAEQEIMKIANDPNIPIEDKRGAINQIMAQQKGGAAPTGFMPSSNKYIQAAEKFKAEKQGRDEARADQQGFIERVVEAGKDRRAAAQGGQKPPAGYVITPDGSLEPWKGGPVDVKAEIQRQKELDKGAGVDKQLDAIERNLDKIISPEGKVSKGLKSYTGQIDQYYPEFAMTDKTSSAGSALKSLQEQMTMMNLAAAKSAVGQSFGSMQVKEWDKFMNLLTNISRGTPDVEIEANLKFIRDFVRDKRDVLRTAIYGGTYGIGGPKPDSGGQSASGAIGASPTKTKNGATVSNW